MKKIAVMGAGKIGATIAHMLSSTRDYQIVVTDCDDSQLESVVTNEHLQTARIDISDHAAMKDLLTDKFAVLSAAPFHLTKAVADAAVRTHTHYLDLTEDVASTRHVKSLAGHASTALIPQCGLAPGFISIVANDLVSRFNSAQDVRMRVGALPTYPSNALNYNLTWSTDGVINEYCEPCEAIVNGALQKTAPLGDLEEFSLDGVLYEAFNTSGGLGTLCESLQGKVRSLNYRSIRYPGHRDIMKALLHDLRLADRRNILHDILEHSLPTTHQDVVIIFVTVSGLKNGRLTQETYANKVYAQEAFGANHTAIQLTTASSICAVLDLLVAGALPHTGFVRQEDISLSTFLSNRFGRVYAKMPGVGDLAA